MDLALRAVSDPTRRAMLDFIREHGESAVTVNQVSAAIDVHRTVAFEHLEMLADAGLLQRGRLGGRRGRPARTYRFAGRATQVSYPPRQHQLLAGIMASALDGNPRNMRAVRRAAHRTGFEIASGKRGPAAAVRALSSLGGRYRLEGATLHARNCIFREACAANPVVCDIHAGIVEGALEAAGATRIVTPSGADSAGGCRYRLELIEGARAL